MGARTLEEGEMDNKVVVLVFVSVLTLSLSSAIPVRFATPVLAGPEIPIPNHMIVATVGEPNTVDPAWAYDTVSAELIFNVYEPLVRFDRESVDEFVPCLATEWSMSPDGLRYTFRIREGVKFHNGETLTTEDVEYSFERAMVQDRSGSPVWMLYEPLLNRHHADMSWPQDETCPIQTAVESNSTHVWFKLARPYYPPFLSILAQSWGSIVNKAFCIAHGDWPGTWNNWTLYHDPDVSPLDSPEPVMCGTGPYIFDYWDTGVAWSIYRNVNYWGLWPAEGCGGYVDTVTELFIPEWSTMKTMFLAGDCDFCYVPRLHLSEMWLNYPSTPEQYPPGIRCMKDQQSLSCSALFFNFQINSTSPYIGSGLLDGSGIPPDFFSDIDVSKGFAYSFNYTSFIEDEYLGEAIQPSSPIIEGLPYHNPNNPKYTLDLAKAEEHFRAAWGGQVWTKGFTMAIAVNVGSIPTGTYIGILKTSIESLNPNFHIERVDVPWPTFIEQLVHQELPIFTLGWPGDYPDPHNFVYPLMHAEGDFPRFQSVQYGQSGRMQISYTVNGVSQGDPTKVIDDAYVDEMIENGIKTAIDAEREAIYFELQQIYFDECPSVPLAEPMGRHWERTWVQGYYYNPTYPGYYFYHLWKSARAPPVISILSPQNTTYTTTSVPLTFTVSEAISWIGYTLDGQANMTITGNTTLTGLSDGTHSLIVYAKDTAGNTGASEIVYFSIETKKAEPFPIWFVATIVVIAIVGVPFIVYFAKVKKTTSKP